MILDPFNESVRKEPGASAVVDGDRTWTRAALAEAVLVLRESWTGQVFPADRVAIFLPNGGEFIAAFLAVVAAGAVAVPLSPHLRAEELGWYVETLGIRRVVAPATGSGVWEELAARFDDLRILPGVGPIPEGETVKVREIRGVETADPDPWAVFLSTSGSTGRPKIVPRRCGNLLSGAANVGAALGIRPSDRFLAVVPFHHANGFSNCMFLPLVRGAAIVTMDRFVPRRLPDVVRKHRVTVLIGSPFIFRVLIEQDAGPDVFRDVRIALSSGAPMAPGLIDRCRERLGIRVRQLYGSTETGTIAIEPADAEVRGAAGLPVPGVEVRILGEGGKALPGGEVGEVAVRSAAVMEGYVEGAGGEAPFQEGFLRTGDLGFLDARGILHLRGRIRRGINLCGIKVDPVEIERVIGELPSVRSVRVDGVADEDGMERIRARIRLIPGATPSRSDVVKQCRARLAEYKIPREIEFVESEAEDILGKNSV